MQGVRYFLTFFFLRFECFSFQTEASSKAVSVIFGIPQIISFNWYTAIPFDQKLQCEFPQIFMAKWYRLFPVWKTTTVRLEFFNDFYV